MIKVGLTGGIGSGKSEVARLLAGHGAVIVDADVLAREAVAPGSPGLAAVVARFGAGVLGDDGALDRAELARVVFDDPERRADLEAVVHPYVQRRSDALAAAAPDDSVVVFDVPLLVEKRLQSRYDLVVVVEADEESRLRRLVEGRGMGEADARSRISAQATDDQRRAVADVVVDNSRDLEWLGVQVGRLWRQLSGGA